MATIPRYWYCETDTESFTLEYVPWSGIGPCPPVEEQAFFVNGDGEVYGEAILMAALPWPRFRAFSTGTQVALPHRAAVALERLELHEFGALVPRVCPHCSNEVTYGTYHYRVEQTNVEAFSLTFWCNRHFEFSSMFRAKRNMGPARLGRVSYAAAKLRHQEPVADTVNAVDRLDIILHK